MEPHLLRLNSNGNIIGRASSLAYMTLFNQSAYIANEISYEEIWLGFHIRLKMYLRKIEK